MLKKILFVLPLVTAFVVLTDLTPAESAVGSCDTIRCGGLQDCDGLQACVDGTCRACTANADCGSGYYCDGGQCHVGPDPTLCNSVFVACNNSPSISCDEGCEYGCGVGDPVTTEGVCMNPHPPDETCSGGSCVAGTGTCEVNEDCSAGSACVCGACVSLDASYFESVTSFSCWPQ